MKEKLSYERAGVNIDVADATKREMAEALATTDRRVLNKLGAFATLLDGTFPEYEHPVLVLKTEEPGSKQKLAFQYNRVAGICYDMIHHLVNDIVVMGAKPVSVQDVIVCGKLDKDVVKLLVASMAEACRAQGCVLTGGETSEQPGVVEAGTYILASSIVGVVEKAKIVDGSHIRPGDIVLAAESNGLHTNGYSLVRALIASQPGILETAVGAESFVEAIMRPHRCYYQPLRGLLERGELHGMAHITGGGIQGNLNRVLPAGLDALIDLDKVHVLPVFKAIRDAGSIDDADMLRTFNLGVGMTLVVAPEAAEEFQKHLSVTGVDSCPIGAIVPGAQNVRFRGQLRW